MSRRGTAFFSACCLFIGGEMFSPLCCAQEQGSAMTETPAARSADAAPSNAESGTAEAKDSFDAADDHENAIGMHFIQNLAADQEAIWTSPLHLHWDDASWLLPLGEATEGFFATDRATVRALSTNPAKLNRYRTFSNYGLASLVGAGAGLYVLGRLSHDEHKRETGVLVAEAVINSLAVSSTLQYSLGRDRPFQDGGRENFFQGGTSFPSDHATMAWSAASVIAHEYPGPLTDILAYGMASAVSASRVMGKEHAPSDVLVGGAIGWLVGREVYMKHHDPELGGGDWGNLSGNEGGEEQRDHRKMGSPFVPLDSWVYPAMDRLAASGYVSTSIAGLKPWTRIECARLTEEAGEALQQDGSSREDLAELQDRLKREFAREIGLLSGGRNVEANLESVYTRVVSISGPALTDSYHFGQTVSYDFGRPFERGTNGQAGAEVSASAGPIVFYVRGEYQHAPSAPAPSDAVLNVIALRDGVPPSEVPSGPIDGIDRPRLLDAYIGVNLNNWQITVGQQSLQWAPGPGGSMLWSNNIEPVNMVRLVNPEPLTLPGFLAHLGPVKLDQFVGRFGGHPYVPRPFIYGQKINLRLAPWLEVGFGRTTTLGGKGVGPGNAVTLSNVIHSLVGVKKNGTDSVPGDAHAEMDWTFYVPKVRNYLVLYGDGYADDDPLPIAEPVRNPWRPGIYITRFPGIPKLDFHIEGVSTEYPGAFGGGNHGDFNYWNFDYRDGYTNDGKLVGNTVGREGRAIQFWFNYWQSPRNILQFNYKHSTVNSDFIPGGGAWQDYSVRDETYLRSGFYLKGQLQYENISRYPILFSGPQRNVTAIVEFGFSPVKER
jgi:membrane-associated phospholipid phosphatase